MDDETTVTLMVDLHREGARQGPGSNEETRRALDLTRLDKEAELQVADIGCGTGASHPGTGERVSKRPGQGR